MQLVAHATQSSAVEAYAGNVLIDACGPILSQAEILRRLIYLPPVPANVDATPIHIRKHLLADILRMHIPTSEGLALAESIGFMIRQGYVHRNPASSATWQRIYAPGATDSSHSAVQLGSTVVGLSGVGKSTAVERALALFPQVVIHESFPRLANPVRQLVWLKVDVPQSGKIRELVENMAIATDSALGTNYAEELLSSSVKSGGTLANLWLGKVFCHFPGLLVLDEIQNLFKIERKAVREAAARAKVIKRPELRVADDEALKLILNLTNTTKIPVLACGTPDGIDALGARMSTIQRLVTAGCHRIPHAVSVDDDFFRNRLFPQLCKYQWQVDPLEPSDEFRHLLHVLSGGIFRICMALWIHAHRRSFERGGSQLALEDFRYAAVNSLAPLQPAVKAILSGDPRLQLQYEDLLPAKFGYW